MAKVGAAYLKRQMAVLSMHHGLNRDRTRVAADLGVSTDQYKRYVLGTTMLRPDLIVPLAEIYGVPAAQLAEELAITGETPFPVRAYLAAHRIVPADRIEQLGKELRGLPEVDQIAVCDAEIEGWRRQQEKHNQPRRTGATPSTKRVRKRAAG